MGAYSLVSLTQPCRISAETRLSIPYGSSSRWQVEDLLVCQVAEETHMSRCYALFILVGFYVSQVSYGGKY